MKKEDKELLLKDLCARLPFGVKLQEFTTSSEKEPFEVLGIKGEFLARKDYRCEKSNYIGEISIEWCKSYLRPMSSMTEEEGHEYRMFIDCLYNDFTSESTQCVYVDKINDYLDWLNAHHFDFRNLIERGLAIDCTGLNIY